MPKKNKPDHSQKMKLSTTCMVRALCKYCQTGPSSYFYSRNPKLFKNVKYFLEQFEYIKQNVKRMCSDSPPRSSNLKALKYECNWIGYNPKLHRTRGSSNRTNFVENLTCQCNATVWSFNYKSTSERKEITMRQSPRTYPKKYE